jgi:pseudouridine-5'-phosphate glycosidase
MNYLNINPEVKKALADKKPIVALESTIIAHGMPYPQNVQTALEVEQIIREHGAIPATIAILDGQLCVGLDEKQLTELGSNKHVMKVSIRDISYVLSEKIPGATTVASTMRIANMAGISVFVTGGIGGVHRDGQNTLDISADLDEMAQTPVTVVSAGIKSILDIGLTLEYLETKGIPVMTFGSDSFPSFYSIESGHKTPIRIDTAQQIASMIRINKEIGFGKAMLVANPVPGALEIPHAQMENYITEALNEARLKNIHGKNVTPFVLKNISERTGGNSLKSNIALVKNNAKLGAEIARYV